ncbi:MAG: hypothetical protein GX801_10340, partial [Fibrobacter sp.]|nr:hypothetical protein [Fibrobacter sp.]
RAAKRAKLPIEDFESVLLKNHKAPQVQFFSEFGEADDRNNKQKYSPDSKLPEKPTRALRGSSMREETHEELVEKMEQELKEENRNLQRSYGVQACTKCGKEGVEGEFRVGLSLGYCAECAEMLALGTSKEARRPQQYATSLKKSTL